jgi:hypothetical protein
LQISDGTRKMLHSTGVCDVRWVAGRRKRLVRYAGHSRLDELKFVDLVMHTCVRVCVPPLNPCSLHILCSLDILDRMLIKF